MLFRRNRQAALIPSRTLVSGFIISGVRVFNYNDLGITEKNINFATIKFGVPDAGASYF